MVEVSGEKVTEDAWMATKPSIRDTTISTKRTPLCCFFPSPSLAYASRSSTLFELTPRSQRGRASSQTGDAL